MPTMLSQRLIFGTIMTGLLILALLLDQWIGPINIAGSFAQSLLLGRSELPAGLLMFTILWGVVSLAACELAALYATKEIKVDRLSLWFTATVGLLLAYLFDHADGSMGVAICATAMTGLLIVVLARFAWLKRTQGALAGAGAVMFTFIYLGLLPGFYLAIRHHHSAWMIAAIILITKSCDIGAYFTGRAVGRHKLIAWLSPGKTWEGLGGGLILAAAVAVFLTWLDVAGIRLSLPAAAAAGVLFGALGQIGDLVASMFKRDAEIKDYGHSVPGFGGVLDVLDSVLLVGPIAYWLTRPEVPI